MNDFLPGIDFAGSNTREDAFVADRVPVALFAEVVNIRVSDPHDAITVLCNATA
jgi:hypothetical protein